MPFPMKIQPVDTDPEAVREPIRIDSAKPVLKSRLRRLFDRPFPSVLRISSADKPFVGEPTQNGNKDGGGAEFEPSSVCLAKMVQYFIEESNEKQATASYAAKCGRNRCNCFNANNNDSSGDELDVFGGFSEGFTAGSSGGDACDVIKSLVTCASVSERNLLADVAKLVERTNKTHRRKDELRKVVTDGLSSLGYDSSICKSKWEKSPSIQAGEHEYIDVVVAGERFLVDIDFRSEFEIARPTGVYRSMLQLLPYIFVGRSDRLGQIVSVVSEAAKQSLKKKGMHLPPWRKAEYMRAKWLSAPIRAGKSAISQPSNVAGSETKTENEVEKEDEQPTTDDDSGELEAIFGEQSPPPEIGVGNDAEEKKVEEWKPPAITPKCLDRGAKVVTGLASLLKEQS